MLAKLDLGHLVEGKLDGGLAAEDGDHDLDLAKAARSPGPRGRDDRVKVLAKLDLGHLVEGKLDGGLAAEDGDHDLDLACIGHNLGNRAIELSERTVGHLHRLTDLEVRGGLLRSLAARALHDLVVLVAGQRLGVALAAHETGDARRVANGGPAAVVQLHADEHVAREHLLLALHATATLLDLGDHLRGDLDAEDVVLETHGLDALLEIRLHLVLVARVGVQHVPFLSHRLRPNPRDEHEQRRDNHVIQQRHEDAEKQQGHHHDAAPAEHIGAGRPRHALHLGLHVTEELEALLLRLVVLLGGLRGIVGRRRLVLGALLEQAALLLFRRLGNGSRVLLFQLAVGLALLTGSGGLGLLCLGFLCHGIPYGKSLV